MRACAVETHLDISQKPLCVEIYSKSPHTNPTTLIEHRAFTLTVRTPLATLFGENMIMSCPWLHQLITASVFFSGGGHVLADEILQAGHCRWTTGCCPFPIFVVERLALTQRCPCSSAVHPPGLRSDLLTPLDSVGFCWIPLGSVGSRVCSNLIPGFQGFQVSKALDADL